MAIDMLESTEGGVFTDSRLGNKCFINDDDYSNLFGSKKAKKRTKDAADRIYTEFRIPEDKKNDCKWLNDKLIQANNMYEAVLTKNMKKRVEVRETRPLADVIASLKTALQQNNCAESEALKAQEQATQQTLNELAKATKDNPIPPEGEAGSTTPDSSSKTNKYILYGIGGIVAVALIVVLIKKQS